MALVSPLYIKKKKKKTTGERYLVLNITYEKYLTLSSY